MGEGKPQIESGDDAKEETQVFVAPGKGNILQGHVPQNEIDLINQGKAYGKVKINADNSSLGINIYNKSDNKIIFSEDFRNTPKEQYKIFSALASLGVEKLDDFIN